ncbi:MAG: DNA primase [Clostridium sp.]|nr:DNA primase [Clostridium sp.]MCM1444021.1 DNA primase [Candidatus Amulumruptor caecigallinarius]
MINNDEITDIRNSVDIVDVISRYIPLTPKGKNYFGVCPFHDDHSPSMSVSREKQIYTCFTCGATGNVFKFIMDYENISFKESLKIVADIAGKTINIKNIKHATTPNQELYDIYDISAKYYQNNINTTVGKEAKNYLYERLIDDNIIKEFQIGLALKEGTSLVTLLSKKNYNKENLIKSGLILKSEKGYIDIFYNRIMFPLYDIQGRIVAYSGRIYNQKSDSKYINTMETEIFKKGEILYNYHRAKEEARTKNQIIIVEGFMDVIRLYSIGIKNVVASMGTAVTRQQVNLLKRLSKNIILLFDGDKAGAKATYSCSNELIKVGIIPKIVRLEENLDPDDYVKKYGSQKIIDKINNPINIMDFKLSYLKKDKDFNNNMEKATYINEVLEELNKIEDDILKELTLQKISEETGLDKDFIKSKLGEKKVVKEKIKQVSSVKLSKYEKAQMYLVYYMLKSVEVIKIYSKKITYIPIEKYRKLAFEIDYFYKKNSKFEMADFITYLECENSKLLDVINEINLLNLKEEYDLEEINDYVKTINEYNIKNECDRLKNKMNNEVSSIEKANLLQQIINLKKQS